MFLRMIVECRPWFRFSSFVKMKSKLYYKNIENCLIGLFVCLFVWCFTSYQLYFSYLTFSTVFSTLSMRVIVILATFNLSSANAFNLVISKILSSFKESTLSSIYTHFKTLKKEKSFRKTLWKKVKLLILNNFTFSYNVFYTICILKSFNSHISIVVCSFFEFGTVSKWCSRLSYPYSFPKQALVFTCLQYKSFENTVGKGEIARHEQFLLFPQCFLTILENFVPFS